MLTQILSNPAVTTTGGSLLLLLLSECMPFLPTKANGVAHLVVLVLQALLKKTPAGTEEK